MASPVYMSIFSNQNHISWVYNMKNKGSSTLPHSTPKIIFLYSLDCPSTITLCSQHNILGSIEWRGETMKNEAVQVEKTKVQTRNSQKVCSQHNFQRKNEFYPHSGNSFHHLLRVVANFLISHYALQQQTLGSTKNDCAAQHILVKTKVFSTVQEWSYMLPFLQIDTCNKMNPKDWVSKVPLG